MKIKPITTQLYKFKSELMTSQHPPYNPPSTSPLIDKLRCQLWKLDKNGYLTLEDEERNDADVLQKAINDIENQEHICDDDCRSYGCKNRFN